MISVYTTWETVQKRAPLLLKDESEETLAPFVRAAESWVDNRLRTAYKVPLTVIDPIIMEIATAEATALAVAERFANRGRDEVTLAQDLHRWAQENLDYCVTNLTLTAERAPRGTIESRPMVATTTPRTSPMAGTIEQAFRYSGGPGRPRG